MEQVWVILGWVVAILMIVTALRLLLKKPQPEPMIEQIGDIPIEAQSQQPVLPRHLRTVSGQQPIATPVPAANVESTDNEAMPEQLTIPLDEIEKETPVVQNVPVVQETSSTEEKKDELDELLEQLKEEDELIVEAQKVVDSTMMEDEQSLIEPENPIEDKSSITLDDIETVEITEWQGESDVLDAHLNAQNRNDEESALATAEQIVALYMYPNPVRALSGERTLKMMLKYGLRFGEMSCFHRYEHPEHPSPLMFSVLRINEDGAPTGFDLETLPNEEVKGLAFFLALPNPNAVQGFDMMASIAGLIARDTEGLVFDEQSLELTPQLRDHWRHFVIEYRSGQSAE